MHKRDFSKLKAFSLLEVSIVVLIIAVIVVGITTAFTVIKQSRIESSKSITRSSPINSADALALWLETTMDSSFEDKDNLNSGSLIRVWNGSSSGIATQVRFLGNGVNYIEDGINHNPSVKFSRSTENYLEIRDASFLNGSDYTVFVVERRSDNSNNNYFIGEDPDATANQGLALGYLVGGEVVHSQGNNLYTAKISSYNESRDQARIFTFVQSMSYGKKIYINGVLSAQSSDKNRIRGITNLEIGKGYDGEIGEIAIFIRGLLDEERQFIEDYLAKKWAVKIDRASVSDCLNGTMTVAGCVVN